MRPSDVFATRPVVFYLNNQTEAGNEKGQAFSFEAVWKWRRGFSKRDDLQSITGDATVYVNPDDPFVIATKAEMSGHLVELDGTLYRIDSQSEGFDFDENEVNHYRLNVSKLEETEQWQDDYVLT